jgi:tetratricopeptide (TPR) repeat protein
MHLGRFDEAQTALEEMKAQFPDTPAAHFNTYFLAFARGDRAAMEQELQWSRGKEFDAEFMTMEGSGAINRGEFKKGEELRKRAVEIHLREGRKDGAAQDLVGLGIRQAIYGKCEEAKATAESALRLHKGRLTMGGAPFLYAVCGDAGRSLALLDEAMKLYPKDTPTVSILAPLVRAIVELNRNNPDQALALLETVRRYDMGLIAGVTNPYFRGLAYLAQRRGAEAAAEFQKIIDNPGIDMMSEIRPLAHVGLARAAAISGDMGKSRTAYQNFFAMWKDADADLPVLIEAKKEYEALK